MDFTKYRNSWSKRYYSALEYTWGWDQRCPPRLWVIGSCVCAKVLEGISGHHLCAALSPLGPRSSESWDQGCSPGVWRPCHCRVTTAVRPLCCSLICTDTVVLSSSSASLASAEGGCHPHPMMGKKVLAQEKMRVLGAPGFCVQTLLCCCVDVNSGLCVNRHRTGKVSPHFQALDFLHYHSIELSVDFFF